MSIGWVAVLLLVSIAAGQRQTDRPAAAATQFTGVQAVFDAVPPELIPREAKDNFTDLQKQAVDTQIHNANRWLRANACTQPIQFKGTVTAIGKAENGRIIVNVQTPKSDLGLGVSCTFSDAAAPVLLKLNLKDEVEIAGRVDTAVFMMITMTFRGPGDTSRSMTIDKDISVADCKLVSAHPPATAPSH